MITLDLSILNQKGTPMFYSDIFAARPTFGIAGRIFISTDTAAIYRDTGSAWDLISDATGTGTNIYNSDGTLTGNRDVSSGGYSLTFRPKTSFLTSLSAANNDSSLSIFAVDTLSYAAGFSSNNIGAIYGAIAGFNLQTFAGSATFAQSNIASASFGVNSIDFSSAGSTITMTQAAGIRAMAGNIAQIQYQGTNSGTITHAAIQQNLGFYRASGATGTLTITNAYSHLINALDDYGAGFTFTNRWGIYQAGASDKNYFAAKMLLGTTTDYGVPRLQVNGEGLFIGAISIDILASPWGSGLKVLDIGYGTSVVNANSYTDSWFSSNAYYNSQWIYKNSAEASYYQQVSGTHKWYIAPSGTAGNPITFTQALTLNASGNLQLGTTSGGNWRFLCYQNASTGSASSSSLLARQDGTDDIVQFWAGASNIASIKSTGNFLIGTTTDAGQKLYLNGSLRIDGQLSATSGGNSGQHLIINLDGTTYKIKLELP